MILHLIVALLVGTTVGINAETRIAVANAVVDNVTIGNTTNITLVISVTFTEVEEGLQVTGVIAGLKEGKYGFHVHELGNIANCSATGAHFNPDDTDHGGRNHTVRHVGDLGNINVNETGIAYLNFVDKLITLRGRNNILGRAIVIHEDEDDLGLGDHETSLTTGNAGARLACVTIGIQSPADPWNSATTAIPSLTVLFLLVLLCITQLFDTIH
ncbi:uncharacterized protein LOC131846881 [Achroia grisella]|uniref:uncharacterized protein LOC131846881 n=1 Tax=Achroia grisella TaxID=688607 RepID=UPI0027D1F181|nr:uncharacterized protein LOC131846881 [Achroia grisella]